MRWWEPATRAKAYSFNVGALRRGGMVGSEPYAFQLRATF
jgi:hypothetical protein